jgi:hypothetical protein
LETLKIAEREQADIVQFPRYHGDRPESMTPFLDHAYQNAILTGREILTEFLVSNRRLWSVCGKLFLRKNFLRAITFANIPDNLHINNAEGFLLVLPICCLAEKYVCTENAGIYYCYSDPTSMSRSFASNSSCWDKFFTDLAQVNEISAAMLNRIEASQEELDGWTRRRKGTLVYHMQQLVCIPDELKSLYLSSLFKCVREDSYMYFFELVAQYMRHESSKLRRKLNTIHSSKAWRFVLQLRNIVHSFSNFKISVK